MAAPIITAVSPTSGQTDVVLGAQLTVTFDQLIDHSTVNDSTFSLTGPGNTQILTAEQFSAQDPQAITGREYITGVFGFDDTSGSTIVTFNPDKPLHENLTYSILVLGGDGVISSDSVKNLGAESMAVSYRWSFSTGALNLTLPPPSAPLPDQLAYIDTSQILVIPRKVVGNDLAQEIDIIFPAPIDPASVNLQDILASVEAILGDPSVQVPPNLQAQVGILGNKLSILITGW